MTVPAVFRSLSGRGRAVVLVTLVVCAALAMPFWWPTSADLSFVAVVRRGPLTATLTSSGVLRPLQSITYRSPIAGRDAEIVDLAPEGAHVTEGDLLVRLDTTDLARDLDRFGQDFRQAELDLLVAEGEWQDAEADVKAVSEGEGALTVDEARIRTQLAQRRVDRLRQEYAQLKPLLEQGFMTRDELAKTSDLLEEAEQELGLARRRTDVVVEMTHPREEKRAALLRDQKASVLEHVRTRLLEVQTRLTVQRELIEGSRIYARRAGLVVYEEFLSAQPRRKIRIGDRVFSSQGIITIPEVNRMLVEASVGEAQVHRVRPGQPAEVRVEAFPHLRLTGHVSRVGALASSSVYRPLDDKRFDLIVELDPTTAELRPEMTVRADVVVGTRENVLLVPVTAVFQRQGRFVVYVVGRAGIEARAVDLGESNDQVVEVAAGLRENERVSLVEPAGATTEPPLGPTAGAGAGHAPQPR